jgi:hypothetical protein
MFYCRDAKKWKTENAGSILLFSAFNCPFSITSLCVSVPLWLVLLLTGCGVPNLEPPACTESRTAVREFYSFHFGNDMKFSPENLKLRQRFITPELSQRLASTKDGVDPFTTGTDELPKAFRVGECEEISSGQTEFQVLLFWRDDTRSEQREIKVAAAKQNEKWLVDNIWQKHDR